MKLPAFLRPYLLPAALLLAATSPAALAEGASYSVSTVPPGLRPDVPAAHPNFTVQVTGKGRPVVLIPGLTCPGAVWDETVARYRRQYQCHVVSLAGFGGAAAPASSEGLLRNVRDQLLTYIKTQQLDRPVIIGHSLGGFLGLWLSVTEPPAIGPLVILDSLPFLAAVQNPALTVAAAKPLADGMRQQMRQGGLSSAQQRQMVAGMVTDTSRQTQLARWGAASSPATVAEAMYDLYTTDLRADLGRIQQPVLVLGAWAAYQPYGATLESTRAIFEAQYAQLPQRRIEMSKTGRHFLMYDDTAWFFALTDAFLQQYTLGKR